MVVMSLEAYKKNLFETKICLKLKEAEYQALTVKNRFTHGEVMAELRKIIPEKETLKNMATPHRKLCQSRGAVNTVRAENLEAVTFALLCKTGSVYMTLSPKPHKPNSNRMEIIALKPCTLVFYFKP